MTVLRNIIDIHEETIDTGTIKEKEQFMVL